MPSYVSKDLTRAVVDANGNVTIPDNAPEGDYYIDVAYDNGKYAGTHKGTVVNDASYIPVTGISLNKSSVKLTYAYDFSKKLKATVSPSNATNKNINWAVSPDNGALSCVGGYLKCLENGEGTFTITASSVDGPSATCAVTIVRNGTVINSIDPSFVTLESADEAVIPFILNANDLDGYYSGYTVTCNVGSVVSRNNNSFSYRIPQNTGEARTITIYVSGNFSGDTTKTITVTQPASTIVSGLMPSCQYRVVTYDDKGNAKADYYNVTTYFTSSGGTSYRHVQNEQGIYISGSAIVYVRCAQSSFDNIVANTVSSDISRTRLSLS